MSREVPSELSLREVVERSWRALPTIIVFWVFTVLITTFVICCWPRTYGSTAQLYLQKGRESLGLDPTTDATGQTIALHQSGRDGEIKSAIDMIGSRGILEPVVDELTPAVVLGDAGVGQAKPNWVSDALKGTVGQLVDAIRSIDPASDRERAVVEIEKHLKVDAERKSEVISVTFESETPELAQAVVQAIVDEYRTKHAVIHRTQGSTEFFNAQRTRLKQELDQRAEALRAAKSRMGIASIEGERAILERQLGEIRSEILRVEQQINGAKATADNLAQQLATRPARLSSQETTVPNSGADMQRQLLYQKKIELEGLKAKFHPDHPEVRAVQNQVAQAQAELDKQTAQRKESTDDVNPVHRELTLDLAENDALMAGYLAHREKLQAQEAEWLEKIKQLNTVEVEIEQLTRDVEVASRKYVAYAESLEEAQIDSEMHGKISSVAVSQPATLQQKPVAPSKPIVAICGALICFVGAIAIAFAFIQFDDGLTSPEAARRHLQVPVLGSFDDQHEFDKVSMTESAPPAAAGATDDYAGTEAS